MGVVGDIALITVVIWYVLAPLAVWRLSRIPTAVVEVGKLGDGPVWSQLAMLHADLPPGFAHDPPAFLMFTGSLAIVSFDRSTNVLALVGAPPNGKPYLEFKTRFAGAQELMTNNSAAVVGLFDTPHVIRQYPDKQAPIDLYQAHLALVRYDGRAVSSYVPENIVDDIKQRTAESLQLQIASRYFLRDGEFLRPTLVGAYRASFMMLHPFLWIRRSRRRSNDLAVLRRAMNAPSAHPTE